jgi:putative ABC transport system permease protein
LRNGEGTARRLSHRKVDVIGVVEDVIAGTLVEGVAETCVYFATTPGPEAPLLLIRGRGEAMSVARIIAGAIDRAHPGLVYQVAPIRQLHALQLWAFGWFSTAAAIPGMIGLLLAFTGTYGVVAFLAAQRIREFGIRMALGASANRLVTSIVTGSLRIAIIATTFGLLVAAVLSRAIASAFEIAPLVGARPYVVAAAVLLTASAVAAWLPLRRVVRVDPCAALRSE